MNEKDLDLNKSFGKIGIFLMEKAQKEVNKFLENSEKLKTELEIKLLKSIDKRKVRMRQEFINQYNEIINKFKSDSILKLRESFLERKNEIIDIFKTFLLDSIRKDIVANIKKYHEFLGVKYKEMMPMIKEEATLLSFNKRDYDFFKKNPESLKKIFLKNCQINNKVIQSIGGFVANSKEGLISFDYTLENLINKQIDFINFEFEKLFEKLEIDKIEFECENKIEELKQKILRFLEEFDKI